ncbi:DUF2339 domain-containing protein [bacterium]|nr:MAG: DUF2339 domain-containing protein [bacterium]
MEEQEIRRQIAELQAKLERRVPPPPPLGRPCAVRPAEPGILDTLRGVFERGLALVKEQGFERFLGERLFAYVGMVLVVLGGAFFLKYAAQHSGPWGRVAVGTLAGFGAAAAGEFLRRKPRLKGLSIPVTAGGWALLLYTAYAAHAVPASRVVADPRLALALLAAAAGGMLTHALAARSRLLTAYAFAVSYFAFAATDFGPQTLGVCTVLALAGAWLVRRQRQPELVPIGLVGFAVNYWPTLERSCGVLADPRQTAVGIGTAAVVYAATALAARPEDMEGREAAWVDAALAFGGGLLAAAVHVQSASASGPAAAAHGFLVAGLLALLAGRRGKSEEGAAATLQALLAAGLAALACWRLPTIEGQLWAFTLSAAALGLGGTSLRRASFERYGLALAALGGATWLGELPSRSPQAAAALAALAGAGYFLAGRGAKETPGLTQRLWLHGGLWAAAAAAVTAGFDPTLRLPATALGSLALLVLGRGRGVLGAELRLQSYALAAAAPVVGAATFLWPGEANGVLTLSDAAVYGASSLVLLGPLALERWARDAGEAVEERAAGHVFAALSVVMTTLFVAREASGPLVTLWWTVLGGGYLLAGLLAERRELRWPALALLGLCVAKAFFSDLTGLALPYRMLSLSALGLLLVLCSLAYVRWVKDEPSVLSLPDGEPSALRGDS